jgi:hypothetical protein
MNHIQPLYSNPSDTYTATGNGTANTLPGTAFSSFSLQVSGTGAAATLWNVDLEASNDGVTYTAILNHATADGNGTIKFVVDKPCLYYRTRCAALTLGAATNIIANVVATT